LTETTKSYEKSRSRTARKRNIQMEPRTTARSLTFKYPPVVEEVN